eukprot:2090521-Prymnesium_polylepis.4
MQPSAACRTLDTVQPNHAARCCKPHTRHRAALPSPVRRVEAVCRRRNSHHSTPLRARDRLLGERRARPAVYTHRLGLAR